MKLFKPEDFETIIIATSEEMNQISDFANAKLKEWLDAAPTVYGDNDGLWIDRNRYKNDTHSAKIVCIEQIKTEPCKHEPVEEIRHTICKHCNVKLDAKWEAVR